MADQSQQQPSTRAEVAEPESPDTPIPEKPEKPEKPEETEMADDGDKPVVPEPEPAPPAQPRPGRHTRPARGILAAVAIVAILALVFALTFQNAVAMRRHRQAQREIQAEIAGLTQAVTETRLQALQAKQRKPAEDHPEDYEYYLERGNTRFEKGKHAEALIEYRSAIEAAPSLKFGDQAHYRFALSMLKVGRTQPAKKAFATVVEEFPRSACYGPSLYELAVILMHEKRHDQARRLLYQLIAMKDGLPDQARAYVERAHYAIARCYEAEANRLTAGAAVAMLPPTDAGGPESAVSAASVPENAGGDHGN